MTKNCGLAQNFPCFSGQKSGCFRGKIAECAESFGVFCSRKTENLAGRNGKESRPPHPGRAAQRAKSLAEFAAYRRQKSASPLSENPPGFFDSLSARSSWRRWCCRSTASWRSRAGRRRARRYTAGARRACRASAARRKRRGCRAGAGA